MCSCEGIRIPESGNVCLWNLEPRKFDLWNLESRNLGLWNTA